MVDLFRRLIADDALATIAFQDSPPNPLPQAALKVIAVARKTNDGQCLHR